MKILKKQISVGITLVLMLSMAISLLASTQPIKAAETWPTYSYITAFPKTVGVGQEAFVTMWLDQWPPGGTAGNDYTPSVYWHFVATITDPDGAKTTKEMDSDKIGGATFPYTPTKIGTYTFQMEFIGAIDPQNNNTYLSSTSNTFSLVVQQEPIEEFPAAPLPTQYWERPIDAQNREWSSISSNWLGRAMYGGAYQGYNNWVKVGSAPNSAHILWTREMEIGGLVGGEYGSESFYGGLSYENKWSGPVIIGGRLYHNQRLGSSGSLGLECVDMRTGEQIWFKNGISIDCGQVLRYDSPNQHGAIPYLWDTGSTYRLYDAFTGEHILDIENASTGKFAVDEKGNLLVYVFSSSQDRLILWNSTKCILNQVQSNTIEYWRPQTGRTYDWKVGIEWNVSIPDIQGSRRGIATIGEEVIVAGSQVGTTTVCMEGYSMETGAHLWAFNVTSNMAIRPTYYQSCEVDGKFAWFKQETMEWYGYNAQTGAQLWGPTDPYEDPWGIFTSGGGGIGATSPVIADGKLYASGYDGTIHCFDMDTGENLWNYYIGDAGFETPYGTWALAMGQNVVADGKIYAACGEHSPSQPLWRGQKMVCVNATTGEEIWRTLGWMVEPIIADGSLATFNIEDNRIYCFGKGPSAVTVSAPDTATTVGTPIVIKGTVIDKSVGALKGEPFGRFPNGVPAMSDDSMDAWMEYVYMDQPLPTDAEGVEVWIDVIDANGNYRNIGTTTSDLSGFYSFEWEPDIPGKYTVIATFAGSDSYWPSYSETAFAAVEPVITPAPTPTPASVADMYFLPVSIGMIVAIVIVLVLLVLLLLRKR